MEYQARHTRNREETTAAISVKNVLYATDFSAISESALPYATAISRRFGSTLHIAHVLSDSNLLLMTGGVDYVSMGTLYEDAHSTRAGEDPANHNRLGEIPYRTYVRHGQVWANLSHIVAENAIDLIVVGTHGRTGLGKLLLGSVAEDILRHVALPGPNRRTKSLRPGQVAGILRQGQRTGACRTGDAAYRVCHELYPRLGGGCAGCDCAGREFQVAADADARH